MSQGLKFRDAIKNNKPLIIPGTINAYSAKLAEKANHQAIYLLPLQLQHFICCFLIMNINLLNNRLKKNTNETELRKIPTASNVRTSEWSFSGS